MDTNRVPALGGLPVGILGAPRIQTKFLKPFGRGLLGVVAAAALLTMSFGASAATVITSASGFVNTAVATQTGTFTATRDGTPSISPANQTLAFTSGAQTAYTGLAAIIRFNTTGTIDAYNGSAYGASTIPFSAGVTYHFRVVINTYRPRPSRPMSHQRAAPSLPSAPTMRFVAAHRLPTSTTSTLM